MKPHPSLVLIAALLASSIARADVRLPALFSDHMVVQAGAVLPVWGWAAPGEAVTVALAGQTQTVKTGPDGKWTVKLPSFKPATTPQTLTVTGANQLIVSDVLIGEVWLCSGQSNMVMPVELCRDFERERVAATLPQIRVFTVPYKRVPEEQDDCVGAWVVCSPETVGKFSGTAYFFARDLHRAQGGAVGLVVSAYGGTVIESWIDPDAQQADPALKPFLAHREKLVAALDLAKADAKFQDTLKAWADAAAKAKAEQRPIPRKPVHPLANRLGKLDLGGLFNGMIAPLIPYSARGILWYQGESNCSPDRAPFYAAQMRLLVRDWRQRWGSELPVCWVQLPNLDKNQPWPEIREAQLRCLDLPKTGMAITLDIGESKDIHPKDKQTVGYRLAQWALGSVYGKEVPAISGPLLAGQEIRGGEIVLRFRHAEGGLVAKSGALEGFIISGEGRAWKPAQARIEGETVIVSASNVRAPVAVRYAWASDPVASLFNGAGLPASPFRTDDWPLTPLPPIETPQ